MKTVYVLNKYINDIDFRTPTGDHAATLLGIFSTSRKAAKALTTVVAEASQDDDADDTPWRAVTPDHYTNDYIHFIVGVVELNHLADPMPIEL